jgi:hypothetical protein
MNNSDIVLRSVDNAKSQIFPAAFQAATSATTNWVQQNSSQT